MRVAALIFAASSLAACGSMSVDIAVLDKDVLIEAQRQMNDREEQLLLERELPLVLSLTEVQVEEAVHEISNRHFAFYVKLGELARGEAESEQQVARQEDLRLYADQIQEDYNLAIRPHYSEAITDLKTLQAEISRLAASRSGADGERRKEFERDLAVSLRQRSDLLGNLNQLVAEDITEARASFMGMVSPLQAATTGESVAETVADLAIFTEGLTNSLSSVTLDADPFTPAIAAATEDDWKGRFHEVYGRGSFGNVNMAFKMEKGGSARTYPEFTLKGLTFDPSDVARMASRLASQALTLAASIAGAPVSEPAAEGGQKPAGFGLGTSTAKLANQKRQLSATETKTQLHDQALQRLAVAILQTWDGLASEEAKQRAAAVSAVKSSYQAIKPILGAQGGAKNQEPQGEEDEAEEQPEAGEDPEEGDPEEDDAGESPDQEGG